MGWRFAGASKSSSPVTRSSASPTARVCSTHGLVTRDAQWIVLRSERLDDTGEKHEAVGRDANLRGTRVHARQPRQDVHHLVKKAAREHPIQPPWRQAGTTRPGTLLDFATHAGLTPRAGPGSCLRRSATPLMTTGTRLAPNRCCSGRSRHPGPAGSAWRSQSRGPCAMSRDTPLHRPPGQARAGATPAAYFLLKSPRSRQSPDLGCDRASEGHSVSERGRRRTEKVRAARSAPGIAAKPGAWCRDRVGQQVASMDAASGRQNSSQFAPGPLRSITRKSLTASSASSG